MLKKSLTIWIIPVFIVSFLFNEFTISNGYLFWILTFYTIVIALNYLKNSVVTLLTDRFFLLILSFLVFVNNNFVAEQLLLISLILSLVVITIYTIAFFIYKRKGKIFILNFSKLSGLIESVFVLFILFFGIKSQIVLNILFFAMCDILYKIIILSIIFNLKKRFSIQ